MMLLRLVFTALAAATIIPALQAADSSGTWVFNPGRGENLGMMAQMKNTITIHQSKTELVEKSDATMMGQHQVQEIRLELDGKPVPNENYMGEKSITTTRWDGPELVTTWTTPGAVPGTTSVSTETRVVSSDRRTLTVRISRAGKPGIAMIYDRK